MKYLKTVWNVRLRYLIGLSTIALLVTASFITMQHVVSKQKDFSRLVNLAGHQAGLCNRIAYFVSIMAVTDEEAEFNIARAQVGRGMNKMKTVHHQLRNGDPENGIPYVTNTLLNTIYGDSMGLDMAITRFLDRVKIAYDRDMESFNTGSAAYIYVTTYGPHVLEPLLDAAVDEYENIGRQAIVQIERFELIIWLFALFVLLLEFGFIFRPLEKNVKKTLISLESSLSDLDKTQQRLLAAQKMALIGDWELDLQTGELTWSDQVYDIHGIDPEKKIMTFESSLNQIHPEDRGMVASILLDMGPDTLSSDMEYRVIRADGGERLVYQQAMAMTDKSGKLEKISGTLQDITERKTLSTRLEKLSEHIPGFIFQFHVEANGNSCFPYAGKGIIDTCGITPSQIKNDAKSLLNLYHDEDRDRVKNNINRAGELKTNWSDQFRIHHPQKGLVWLEGHATPEPLSDGSTQWYGYIWDITQRQQAENQIRRLALYDPLTGLANRRLLKDRIAHAIATSRRNLNYGAIIMLDMDNFKNLNDTKGHNVGDALLIEVAKRLTTCVRETDTIARLGGDEFVVVLEWLAGEKEKAHEKAMEVAQKIRKSLKENYVLSDQSHIHHASASVGVALFKGGLKDVSELLKRADVAMYEAKDLGRNRVCFYNEVRQAVIDKNSKLAHDMQLAINNQEFELFLQPQVDAQGRLCSAEALIRWMPPGKDPVSPGAFIPVAESTGLIIPIGEWVLETACSYLLNLSSGSLPEDFSIAVNISARQLNDDLFIEKVRKIITEKKVDTRRLKFELTETSLVQDLHRGNAILTELRDMGLSIELDDFGTGYSSLNALNNLPLNTLKIDRSLVNGVESDKSSSAIVRAVIAMAKAMSLTTIAEGVETQFQRDFLISEGCDILQGFLYARPMPYDDFIKFVENYNPTFETLPDQKDISPICHASSCSA
ncbi:MAG: EAL domain-containing protein [Proteobacteria bacterium]|nr:EAL domain-containing protein [Pseudomonadota bacterium]MBU1544292.1 EAL domain-containing protein [Pseudomonadota bacterium]MBU2430321.1 EAL domain-containing protein [Pseudomonadota bacterium]MBU2481146.1 EAL domain-containing protein [Pseudomonadota bacterium]